MSRSDRNAGMGGGIRFSDPPRPTRNKQVALKITEDEGAVLDRLAELLGLEDRSAVLRRGIDLAIGSLPEAARRELATVKATPKGPARETVT